MTLLYEAQMKGRLPGAKRTYVVAFQSQRLLAMVPLGWRALLKTAPDAGGMIRRSAFTDAHGAGFSHERVLCLTIADERVTDLAMNTDEATAAPMPRSLIDGVYEMVAGSLGVTNVKHRSALHMLQPFDGSSLIALIYEAVRRNYDQSGASMNKHRSQQNWRWHSPQPQIGEANRSPEVVVERAIVAAAAACGRDDWSNQIPVASGLVDGAGDGRRAIDLVRRISEQHFQFIELKIASDTPLFAAIELLSYACIWLIARVDRSSNASALLNADRIDLRVLAPASFYAPFSLAHLERSLCDGVRALGTPHGVTLSFAYDVLDEQIRSDALPDRDEILRLVDHSTALQPA